ncbi:hypothetical protein [Ruania zhangjianzhongii]|uniref:hypothetical protein n=1 Tax=Ruania zhangjianzhongii TaxID=2603206 RepID=UPI0011C83DE3|nr:hypothetical protein [Ruania zhangjianzhongii]
MRRARAAAAALALAVVTGCGVEPSEVTTGPEPPTGVAPGVTLYFLDGQGEIVPQQRDSGRLGTIQAAIALLLTGPGPSGPRTAIAPDLISRVEVTETPGLIELRVPWTVADLGDRGIDQVVCTVLGVHVQSGGPPSTQVRIDFVQDTPASQAERSCPLISPGG